MLIHVKVMRTTGSMAASTRYGIIASDWLMLNRDLRVIYVSGKRK